MGHHGETGPADLTVGEVVPPAGWPALQATLTEICLCLTEALPAAESAGVVVFAGDGPPAQQTPALDQADVIGAAPAGATVLQIERDLEEGPILTACRSQRIVTSGDIAGDLRWPRFGSAVAALELHSATMVPLAGLGDGTAGVFSAYSHQRDAFDPEAVHLIAAIANVARQALLAAAIVERTRRAYQATREATERARMVNQAVGVLTHRNCTEEQALWRLSRIASRNGEDVATSARMIVEEARTEARLGLVAPRRARTGVRLR